MIPAEAMEAAHKAWREQATLDGSIFEYNLQAAIEAAAPYLMRTAWEEGAKESWSRSTPEVNGQRYQWRWYGEPLNPYRK